MPRLWSETIAAHRREVRDAILDAAAALVAEHGLASVTMSRIAEAAGIGRATLYKYFPEVEAILVAWHERQIGDHLAQSGSWSREGPIGQPHSSQVPSSAPRFRRQLIWWYSMPCGRARGRLSIDHTTSVLR